MSTLGSRIKLTNSSANIFAALDTWSLGAKVPVLATHQIPVFKKRDTYGWWEKSLTFHFLGQPQGAWWASWSSISQYSSPPHSPAGPRSFWGRATVLYGPSLKLVDWPPGSWSNVSAMIWEKEGFHGLTNWGEGERHEILGSQEWTTSKTRNNSRDKRRYIPWGW